MLILEGAGDFLRLQTDPGRTRRPHWRGITNAQHTGAGVSGLGLPEGTSYLLNFFLCKLLGMIDRFKLFFYVFQLELGFQVGFLGRFLRFGVIH